MPIPVDYRAYYLKALKFSVYLWAVRLGCLAFGSSIIGICQFLIYFKWLQTNTNLSIQQISMIHWNILMNNNNNNNNGEDDEGDNNLMHQIHKPILYTNIPVISDRLLKSKLDKLLPIQSIKLKTSSDTNLFSYFSHKHLWSSLYDSTIIKYNYITINQYIQSFKDDNDNDDDDQNNNDKQQTRSFFSYFDNLRKEVVSSSSSSYDDINDYNEMDSSSRRRRECKNNLTSCNHDDLNNQIINPHRYIYSTHSNILPYLSGIAPGLAQFITIRNDDDEYDDSLHGNNDPKVNLWLSSANITTALHYDYEDNYLLQIAGKKHITLISPEAIDILSSYPTYHPLWRQSIVYEQIISADQFISYVNSKATTPSSSSRDDNRYKDKNDDGINDDDDDQTMKQQYGHKHKRKGNQKQKLQIKTKQKQQQQQSKTRNKIENTIYGKIKLWDFDLNPGEMVFIPAGYYHIIHTITDSISVNTWYQSKISQNYEKLLLLSLPFHINDDDDQNITTLDMKITQLIFIVKQVYHQLGLNVDVFKNNLLLRFKSLTITTATTTTTTTSDDADVVDDDQHKRYYKPTYHRDHICSLDAKRMLTNDTDTRRLQCLLTTIHIYNIFKPTDTIVDEQVKLKSDDDDDQDLSTDPTILNISKTKDIPLAVTIQSFIDYFEEVLAAIITAHDMEVTPDLITFIISTCL